MAKEMMLNLGIGVAAAGALAGLVKVSKSLEAFGEQAKKLDANMRVLKAEEGKIKNLEKLKSKYVSVSKEWIQAVAKLRKLKEAYDKSGKSNAELSKKIKEQEKILNVLNKQKERQKHLFEAARSSIEKEHGSLQKYREQLEKTSETLEKQNRVLKINEKYRGQKERLSRVASMGNSMAHKGAGVLGAMAVPVKAYMYVEEAQADLRKILGEEAAKYYNDLQEISKTSPLSQVEVYEIAGALAQSGIDGANIVEYTKKANQLAVAFDMSTREAGEFLAKTQSQLNLGKEELFSYADTINYLADTTAAQANQIVEVSQRVASLGGIAGASKESVAAFGATLISIGKSPEVAATGLKQLYGDLMVGQAATRAQKIAFERLGLQAEQIAKDMVTDGEGTIIRVLERIQELPKHLQASTIKQLFGNEAIDSVAGLSGQVELLKENLEKAKSQAANNAVEKEYLNRISTLQSQLKMSWNNLQVSLVGLGEALAPSIKILLEQLVPLFNQLSNWIKAHPELTAEIMKTVGVIALLSTAIGLTLKFVSPFIIGMLKIINILKKFDVLVKIIKFIRILGLAIKAAFVAHPIGAIIVAIGLLITALVALYKKNEAFRNFVNNMWKSIANWAVSAWNGILNKAVSVYNALRTGLHNFVNFFKNAVNGLVNFFTGAWGKITELASKNPLGKAAGWLVGKVGKNYAGTNYWRGGLTTVAERGAELIKIPGQETFLAQSKMLVNLPKGTQILNNSSTMKKLKGENLGQRLKSGVGLRDRVINLKDKIQNLTNLNNSISNDSITININASANQNEMEIARLVRLEIEKMKNKQLRTAF